MTIDGPAGSGKSTAARLLAGRLAMPFLDTGAMYRAVTVAALRRGVDLADDEALARVAREADLCLDPHPGGTRVTVDGEDATQAIRENEVSRLAFHAAGNEAVRAALVSAQQALGRQWGSLVTEGRDQGTVVFPEAELKVYLDASDEVRAQRRCDELAARGRPAVLEDVLEEIRRRDHSDRSRDVGPLRAAEDAVVVDTSEMTIDEVVDRLEALARERTGRA